MGWGASEQVTEACCSWSDYSNRISITFVLSLGVQVGEGGAWLPQNVHANKSYFLYLAPWGLTFPSDSGGKHIRRGNK